MFYKEIPNLAIQLRLILIPRESGDQYEHGLLREQAEAR